MIWTLLRCQPLRSSLKLYRRPVSNPTRSLSTTQALRAFLRPSRCLRQEAASPLRSSSEKVGPAIEEEVTFYKKVGKPRVGRQILYVAVVSSLALTYAASQTTLETQYWTERMSALSPVWSVKTITNTDLKRAQNAELIQGLRERLASIQSTVQQLPVLIRPWINIAVVAVMQPYADATEGKRLCWKICLLNAAVWAAWKVKRWQPFMTTRFMHYPLSGMSYTLLTSIFSHKSALHLLCNCLALESFGSAAYYYLLREQNKAEPAVLESTTSYHFLAFFVTAGLFSGLVSHMVNAKLRYPRIVAQLASPANASKRTDTWAAAVAAASSSVAQKVTKKNIPDILPSLGASGAIYAAVTMTALAFPESQVALFIPPSYPINIQYGVGGLMLLDMVGIMRGWRLFDHWAHLGGAAFGIFYYNYGPSIWRLLREEATKVDSEQSQS